MAARLVGIMWMCGIVLAGCSGSKSPPAYQLSGSVTFNGQPVPAGVINFDPAAGHPHLPGYATIKNGKYDTRLGGVGHSGGKMQVRISGFDGIAEGELTQGKPIFPAVNVTLDLPAKNSTHDFSLPLKPGS